MGTADGPHPCLDFGGAMRVSGGTRDNAAAVVAEVARQRQRRSG
jgi:hypothetical protein